MELEREAIERSDFSSARRGYEPSEVDAHLRQVATAVNDLQARVEELSSRPESMSEVANKRLQRILDAAEESAAELRTDAGEEARELIAQAQRESRAMTEEAERRARELDTETETTSAERLSRVDRRASELMARADSLDEEFDALLERMRTAAYAAVDTLRADARDLRDEVEELPREAPPGGSASEATTSRLAQTRGRGRPDRGGGGPPTDVIEPVGVGDPATVDQAPHDGEDESVGVEGEPVGRQEGPPVVEPRSGSRRDRPSAVEPGQGGRRGRSSGARRAAGSRREERPAQRRPEARREAPPASEPDTGIGEEDPVVVEAEPLGDEVIPEPQEDEALPEAPEEPEPEPERQQRRSQRSGRQQETAAPRSSEAGGPADSDTEGARLIALNMALSGSSRSETADYLRDTFGLEDRALLDDVFDRVQSS